MERKESSIPWFEEDIFSSKSTAIPEQLEILEEENPNHIATVIIFVVSALVTITLLFIMAIFIDCRQQKLDIEQQRIIRNFGKKGQTKDDDLTIIVDNMHQEEIESDSLPGTSSTIINSNFANRSVINV